MNFSGERSLCLISFGPLQKDHRCWIAVVAPIDNLSDRNRCVIDCFWRLYVTLVMNFLSFRLCLLYACA